MIIPESLGVRKSSCATMGITITTGSSLPDSKRAGRDIEQTRAGEGKKKMNNQDKITNYMHYQRDDCITLMHDAFSSGCVQQSIDLNKLYSVKFVGELGVPITVEGTFVNCIVEGSWCKYIQVIDSRTLHTWNIYTGNGSENRGIISMTEVVYLNKSRPVWHGSKNHDMFETMLKSPGGKPVLSVNKDF